MSDLRRLIVSDEALLELGQDLTATSGPYLSPYKRLVTQVRYTGTGFLGAAQMGSELDPSVTSNIAFLACLRCSRLQEAREAARMLGLSEDRVDEILHLPLGYGFVRSAGFDAAVKVWLPDFPLGPFPSDAEVEQLLAIEREALAKEIAYSPADPDDAAPLDVAAILGEQPKATAAEPVVVDDATRAQFLREHQQLLQDIRDHPSASVTQHYRHLGWSAWRGNRVKRQLLDMQLIRSERQKSANGRPQDILSLTEKGRLLLNERQT